MRMSKKRSAFVVFVFVLAAAATLFFVHPRPLHAENISVLTFNAGNVFDAEIDGDEYPEYRPPKWSREFYEKRLVAVGQALQRAASSADVIVLQEVENERVVKDLQRYYLPAFKYAAVTDNEHSATEVALLSRIRITAAKTHSVDALGSAALRSLRPVLDVRLSVSFAKAIGTTQNKNQPEPQTELQILAVHLKSKRASRGAVSSDEMRRRQYLLLAAADDASVPTLIVGDFNDESPARSLAAAGGAATSPNVSAYKNARDFTNAPVTGTFYFRNEWEQIDHVLMDGAFAAAVRSAESVIVAREPFVNAKGLPNRVIDGKSGPRGVSDHLPLLFTASW